MPLVLFPVAEPYLFFALAVATPLAVDVQDENVYLFLISNKPQG
jgi:hypothetical protein